MNVARFVLEKSVWTEADFDQMGWHDATVHGIALLDETWEFALDIDYIFKWVTHEDTEPHSFTFWVAPCTLVFENVTDLSVELTPFEDVSIEEMSRSDQGIPRNADYIGKAVDWRWTIECGAGEISFRSAGYKQYVRTVPVHGAQRIPVASRGGVSFAREAVRVETDG